MFGDGAVPTLDFAFDVVAVWKLAEAGAWSQPAAIHLLEGRAAVRGLGDVYERIERPQPSRQIQVLRLVDNLAEVMATDGGRAKDAGLNACCRKAAGLQVSRGIRWHRRYVPSARNCADAPSRLADAGVLVPGQRFREQGALDHHVERRRGREREPVSSLPPGPAFVEVFSGSNRLTSAVADAGLRVGLPFDSAAGECFNICNPKVYRTLRTWIESGWVWCLWLAIPCNFDSIASVMVERPAEERQHRMRLIDRCRALIKLCFDHCVYFVVENPRLTRLWRDDRLWKLM